VDLNDPTAVGLLAAEAFEAAGVDDGQVGVTRFPRLPVDAALDRAVLDEECLALALELPDVDVTGRWSQIQAAG